VGRGRVGESWELGGRSSDEWESHGRMV
jgi:hypothetical protein